MNVYSERALEIFQSLNVKNPQNAPENLHEVMKNLLDLENRIQQKTPKLTPLEVQCRALFCLKACFLKHFLGQNLVDKLYSYYASASASAEDTHAMIDQTLQLFIKFAKKKEGVQPLHMSMREFILNTDFD